MRYAYQGSSNTLGDRLDLVQIIDAGTTKVPLVDDLAVAGNNNGFQLAELALLYGVVKTFERLCGKTLGQQQSKKEELLHWNFRQLSQSIPAP
jgi:hypothetical protein